MDIPNTPHPLVFVLDDEPGIILLCKRLLERAGFRVESFSAPGVALAALENNPIDLLLVDIRMPELDGFQAIDRARQLQPDLAVVVMTGFGTVETAIEALRRGADGLILKPFSGNELVVSVQRALEQNRHKQDQIRLQALRPLFDITEALFTETNPKRLQSLILTAVCGHLHCSHAEYFRQNPSEISDPLAEKSPRMRLVGSLHYPGRHIQPEMRPTTAFTLEPLARHTSLLRIPLMIQVDGPGEAQLQQILSNRGLGSVLCAQVNLKMGVGVGGVLIAARDQDEPRFRLADLDMFAIFARQAAVAFENARLHAELRAYIRQLEDSQRALIQAEKMAIAGRLTTSIAHEINNPLQAVQNCLHLAERSQLPAEQRHNYLQMAHTELDRLMATVQRMLDFYRPAALDRKQVDINQLLQKVLSLIDQQLTDHQVVVRSRFSPNLPPVMVVSDQIQQVILNLILNAIEAMPSGGSLLIESSLNSANPAEVEVLFQDSGPGIPPSQRKHLFEPFVSTKEHGTGLGLTVSYGIITAHGGSLDLVDRPKVSDMQGACFRITLPVAEHT
mgnify:CR=1 FL=1